MATKTIIEREQLQTLVAAAQAAQETFWDAERAVEKYIGADLDELEVDEDGEFPDADQLMHALDLYPCPTCPTGFKPTTDAVSCIKCADRWADRE